MNTPTDTPTELYRKYRPRKLSTVVGQAAAVASLSKMIEKGSVPHALLFVGPSGCGKTTLARIMQRRVGCGDDDFQEVNCADFRGIEMVREIRDRMGLAPISGDSRVWLIDEAQKLTGDAQAALLKMLEDTPKHVYFFICTTDPQKLIPTIRTRCTEIKVKSLTGSEMQELLLQVLEKEGKTVEREVIDLLIERAEGSARKGLVLLHQIIDLEGTEAQLAGIEAADSKTQAIQLARLLINPGCQWGAVAALLKDLEDEPETVRRLVLGYASSVLLGGGKLAPRAFQLIDVFDRPFFDSGKPGLVAACYAVARAK